MSAQTRRHIALVLLCVSFGALAGCDAPSVARKVQVAAQRTTGLTCDFRLDAHDKHVAEGDETLPTMAELRKDTDHAFTYVNAFWKRHWAECFDSAYEAPRRLPNVKDTDEVYCGSNRLSSMNAAYCSRGRWVAMGSDLIALGKEHGDMLAYVAVAHELGHGVQDQLRGTFYGHLVESPGSKASELQADCFAGAALSGSAQEKGGFTWQDHDAQEVNEAYELFGDLESVQDQTHGDASERVASFQQGRQRGVSACFTPLIPN